MMSTKRLIAATVVFAQENLALSWYYFLSTLFVTALAFVGTYQLSLAPAKLVCSILAGLLACRLFVLYHDFQHEAILRRSGMARVLMNLVGLLTLSPNSIWVETHHHHHANNSKFSRVVMGSFPTLTVSAFRHSSPKQRRWYLMLRHPLMIVFAYLPIFLVSFCLWPFFENPRKYYDCGLAVIIHALIYWTVFMLGGWTAIFYTVLLPSLFLFAIGGYIFYAQHNFPTVQLREDEDWDYLEAALQSSSFIKMNKVMHWFTANIGYHHVHHVNSRIPFYRLPETMKAFSELQHPRTTSLKPNEIIRCLRLKLWDTSMNRMITLDEYHAR